MLLMMGMWFFSGLMFRAERSNMKLGLVRIDLVPTCIENSAFT